MNAWFGAGLKPLFSRRSLIVLSIVIVMNLLYGFAVAVNPLLMYLSGVFLILYGFSLLLVDSADTGREKGKPAHRTAPLSLGVILLASLALRSIGANWGFPMLAHPDEFSVTEKTAAMVERGSLDPDNYTHPNDISIYASQVLYPVVNKILSPAGFTETFEKDRKPFYLTSRLVTAASGVLMTAAAYCIGGMVAPAVGIIAAVIFTIFPPFVENSHYATPDVLVTALLMFVLLYCVRYLKNGRARDLFLALVFSCLAMAEKYSSFLTLPLLLFVVIVRAADGGATVFDAGPTNPLRARKTAVVLFLIALAFGAVGAYSLRSPGFYDLSKEFITSVLHRPLPHDIEARTRTISKLIIAGGLLLGALAVFLRFLKSEKYTSAVFVIVGMAIIMFLVTPFLFINVGHTLYTFSHEARNTHLGSDNLGYLGNLLFYAKDFVSAAGILLLLFMAIGIVFVFREKSLLPLFFSFFYWIFLSTSGLHWARWALPMHAGPLLLASTGIYRSWLFVQKRIGRGGAFAVLGVLCAIPAASLFLTSVTTTHQFILRDTRVVALAWCQKNGVTAENAVYDGYTPFQPGNAGVADYFGAQDAKFVVVSSNMYDRFLKEKERYKSKVLMYSKIFELPLMASFTPVKVDASSSFELGNVAAQVKYLLGLDGRSGPAYRGPTILVFRKTG